MNLPTIDTTRGIHKTSIEWPEHLRVRQMPKGATK